MKNTSTLKDKFTQKPCVVVVTFGDNIDIKELIYNKTKKCLRMQLYACFGYSKWMVWSEDQDLIKKILPLIKHNSQKFKVELLGNKILSMEAIEDKTKDKLARIKEFMAKPKNKVYYDNKIAKSKLEVIKKLKTYEINI
jgi:hypothetical protein